MSPESVRFGVVGLGMGRHHAKAIASTENAQLVAVVDKVEEKAKEVAEELEVDWYTDYRCLLDRDDVDAVMICTPSGMHGEMATQAAEAGKHVLTDKPMEITLEKADAMIEAAERAGVKLGVYFQHRFAQSNRSIKRFLDEGKLGKVFLGELRLKWFRTQEYYDLGGWRGTWAMDGGGSAMNQGVHYIDILRWFMGPVDVVYGRAVAAAHKIETEDLTVSTLVFKSGALGSIITTTSAYPTPYGTTIEIYGTEGSIITEEDNVKVWHTLSEGEIEHEADGFPTNPIEDFVDAILNDREPLVNGYEGRKSIEVVTAIYESSRLGEPVKVRSIPETETS